jgi:hypothetical protein
VFLAGVPRNEFPLGGWAPWVLGSNRAFEGPQVGGIQYLSLLGRSLTSSRPHVGVLETLRFGSMKRALLHQDPLPLIATTGSTKPKHNRSQG